MWSGRYWSKRFWSGRYWTPNTTGEEPAVPPKRKSSGGGFNYSTLIVEDPDEWDFGGVIASVIQIDTGL